MIAPDVQELTTKHAAHGDEDALLEISLGPHHPSTHGCSAWMSCWMASAS